MCLACSFFYPTPFIVAHNSIVFLPHYILNQGAIVGDEPCLPVGDVALNVSSSKFDDVATNASKVYFSVHLLVAYFLLLVLFILFTFFEFLFLSDY